jgi:hypothetical protein
MEIKVFGYEVRVEIVIACIIIGMVAGLFMFCDCFQYSILEGMQASSARGKEKMMVERMTGGKAAKKATEKFLIGKMDAKEGFTNLNNNDLHINDSYTMGWVQTAKQYASGMGYKNKLNSYKDNVGTPVPLPEGELFFFADNKFKPECCPSTYSDSMGCACLSQDQVTYINQRGGNRTLGPTEF